MSCQKNGKFAFARDMESPDLHAMISVDTTPSGCSFKYLMFSSQRTDDGSADTKANSISNFLVNNLRDNVCFLPRLTDMLLP